MTQQVSHRPIKCQSRLWSQRGTKVNGSHHGDNPLLRPTGIQIATKSYAALQAMAPTNIKTVHQTFLLHIETNLNRLGMLSPTHDQRSQQKTGKITLQPVLIVQVSQGHTFCTEIRKIEIPRSMVVEMVKPAREPASPKPCALKKPHESPVRRSLWRRKKNDRVRDQLFSETSRFKPVILAHRGSLARQRSSCPPPSPNLVRTHPIVEYYQALRDSASCLSRAATLGHQIGAREEARTWEHHHPQPTIPPPRLNRQAESRRQPVGCIS